jgi:hypothetical protein
VLDGEMSRDGGFIEHTATACIEELGLEGKHARLYARPHPPC